MSTKAEIIERLLNPGIIAVIRARNKEQCLPLSEALLAGGVIAIEITLTTPDALTAIRQLSGAIGDKALIGVGTVLDETACRMALEAGAQFVVSPICRRELVPVAHAAGKPIMLGAFTPTEAQSAHETGTDFVKLFPADSVGPTYIKALLAPLPHLRIVPTGGVDLHNIADFLRAGSAALGVGSSLVSQEILKNADWAALTGHASAFVKAAVEARQFLKRP